MSEAKLAGLHRIAERSHGLVTTAETTLLGVTKGRRRTLQRQGVIARVGRGVHRVSGTPRTGRQRVLGACLDAGGVASHRTAAALHGLKGFSLEHPLEILVRDGPTNARSSLARLHTTNWLPDEDLVMVDAIPTTGVARTLLSLAALAPELTIDKVRGAVDDAISTGLASDAWLWWLLESRRRSGRNGVTVFEAILELRNGGQVTESWLERETLRLIADAGLPLPICQARIEHNGAFVARVDFLYEEFAAVIEVSGYQWHRTKAQTTADAQRRRQLTLAGYQVHEFTYDEIVRHPERLLDTIRAILGLKTGFSCDPGRIWTPITRETT